MVKHQDLHNFFSDETITSNLTHMKLGVRVVRHNLKQVKILQR